MSPSPPRSTEEFARYVGLARSTVSRVLNGHPGIKAKTVARVVQAMEETGFTPNAFALQLRGKGPATVGICIESLARAPMTAKLAMLQRRLRIQGITSLIEVLPPGDSHRAVQHLRAMRARAVVFLGQFATDDLAMRIAELRRCGVAHVLIDQTGVPQANTVSLDRIAAMREITLHLHEQGHRSFGLLGMSGGLRSIQDRVQGVWRALEESGLDPTEAVHSLDHTEHRQNDFMFGRKLARAFADRPDRPTAYLAVNDEVAIGAMLSFQERGLQAPRDLSIVGFNNQDLCLITTPTITSIDQQIDATIDAAINMLVAQLEKPFTDTLVQMIKPVLVHRGSSGPPDGIEVRIGPDSPPR